MSRHKILCHDREWPQQGLCCRGRAAHDRAVRGKASMHVVSNDKL